MKKIKDTYACQVFGLDPSESGVAEANIRHKLDVVQGVATKLPWPDDHFDIVIIGFCLWLIEPREWLSVVGEVDRVLHDTGLLIIHDYIAPRPFRRPYNADAELVAHHNLCTYHYDWPKLWLAHPAYTMIREHLYRIPTYEGVCVLRKELGRCMALAEQVE